MKRAMNAPFHPKTTVKVEESTDSTVRLPRETLAQLGLSPGDELDFGRTDNGLEMRPKESEFERKMAVARRIMDENYDVLRALAK